MPQRPTGLSLSHRTVVCICNFMKCLSILWVLIQTNRAKKLCQSIHRRGPTEVEGSRTQALFKNSALCTLSDAIASFLEHPDETTNNLRISSLLDFKKNDEIAWNILKGTKWQPREFRWYQAATNRRWLITMLMPVPPLTKDLTKTISADTKQILLHPR